MKNTFEFDGKPVKVIIKDVELFSAKDVAKALGYSNTRRAIIENVQPKNKFTVQKPDDDSRRRAVECTPETSNKGATFLNEQGVYDLIFASNKPSAKAFRNWLANEVLPSIRKTGSYSVAKSLDWSLERLVSKLGYKSMCEAINQSKENPAAYDYSNNADLINRVILGMSAKQYRELNELGRRDAIRDRLEAHVIFAYSRLQFENERLIIEGVDFQIRKDRLKALYARLSGNLIAGKKEPKLKLIINNEEQQ